MAADWLEVGTTAGKLVNPCTAIQDRDDKTHEMCANYSEQLSIYTDIGSGCLKKKRTMIHRETGYTNIQTDDKLINGRQGFI